VKRTAIILAICLSVVLSFVLVFASPTPNSSNQHDLPLPTQKSLDEMLSSVTRIRVIDDGMMSGKALKGKVLLDTRKPEDINSFRNIFKIDEAPSTFGYCMCLGEPTLEFYRGKKLIATISIHHGRSIRWGKWKWDALLIGNEKLLDWLFTHNVKKPKEEYEEDLRQAVESEKQYRKWESAIPECLRSRWAKINWGSPVEPADATVSELFQTAKSNYHDQDELILSLLGWFGSGAGPWSGFPAYEMIPEKMLLRIETRNIIKVVTTRTLTSSQMEGTSRYFVGWDFHRQKPKDENLITTELKQRILNHVKQQKDKDKIETVQGALF